MSDQFDFRDRIVELRRVPAEDLVDNPKNWRGHPDAQRRGLRALVAKIGFAGAELVRQMDDGRLMLIDGHIRKKEFKGQILPVLVTDLNAEEADLLLAFYDKIGAQATQDDEAVEKLLTDVNSYFDDIDDMLADVWGDDWAADDAEPAGDPGAQLDRAEELLQVWQCKRGDLWIIPSKSGKGEHRLLCGDSTNADDVARVMGGERAILMVTDPPYGVEYDPSWRKDYDSRFKYREGKVQNDDIFDWRECYSLFEGDIAYVWHAGKYSGEVSLSLQSCGFEVVYQIIWNKQNHVFGRGDYHWKHEPCFYAVKKGARHHWNGDRTQNTVWDIVNHNPAGGQQDDADTPHGTQKPTECMSRPIRNHDASIVYDPFGGSGTTMVACEQLARQCRMIEIEPKYCAVILQRMADMGLAPVLAT